MTETFIYEDIRDNCTFTLDESTYNKIKDNPTQIEGKVVTLTGDYEVGYGSSGAIPKGFVLKVEPVNTTYNDKLVVSVGWHRSKELIDCAGSETANNNAACDGKGGIIASSSYTGSFVWGVDAESRKCTLYIV